MTKVVINSRGGNGAVGDQIAFDSQELSIDMVTSARLDGYGRWIGRPDHHGFSITHRQRLAGAEHWLFRTAVASLEWKNDGENPPEATFEAYRNVGHGKEEPIMTISTKGLLVSHWSMAWSEGQQEIIEQLELKAWQILSMSSEAHKKIVQSFLTAVGSTKEPKTGSDK